MNLVIDHYNNYSILPEIYVLSFENKFEKKEIILEFSVVSFFIMEREDFEIFEQERAKCPKREYKIFYHGISIEPILCILVYYFRKSINKCYQHGKRVYLTDLLNYYWLYWGAENNHENKNIFQKKVKLLLWLILPYIIIKRN